MSFYSFVKWLLSLALVVFSSCIFAQTTWQQEWIQASPNKIYESMLSISGRLPSLRFSLDAHNGGNMGDASGTIKVQGRSGVYQKSGCRLDFTLKEKTIHIKQKGDCETGMGVTFDGDYVPKSTYHPKPATLYSMEILTAPQDVAAKKMLGQDYQQVIDNTGSCGDNDVSDDVPDAKTMACFVRGVAVTNQFILMHKDNALWLAATMFEGDDVVVRYYTNQPEWKNRLPNVIKSWYEQGSAANFPLQYNK